MRKLAKCSVNNMELIYLPVFKSSGHRYLLFILYYQIIDLTHFSLFNLVDFTYLGHVSLPVCNNPHKYKLLYLMKLSSGNSSIVMYDFTNTNLLKYYSTFLKT